MPSNKHPDRRTFLASVGAAGALGGLTSPTGRQDSQAVRPSDNPTDKWDMSWLDRLKGKHRQVFDIQNHGVAMNVVANYLQAFEDVYGRRHPEVNTVVGIAGRGFPINATDRLWAAWKLGERYEVKDPATGTWAVRNVYYDRGTAADSVRAVQARGAIFWMCNNALNRLSRTWAEEVKRPFDEVRAELLAGLNPGVILVPAHTMLIGLCQERGCTYEVV